MSNIFTPNDKAVDHSAINMYEIGNPGNKIKVASGLSSVEIHRWMKRNKAPEGYFYSASPE